jgi:hypothetical protein
MDKATCAGDGSCDRQLADEYTILKMLPSTIYGLFYFFAFGINVSYPISPINNGTVKGTRKNNLNYGSF